MRVSTEMPESFIHRIVPGDSTALLLLHGTGGNENDLLEIGGSLIPGATLLSPRGKILENGMPRFFRRVAEGVFDEPDLIHRTKELAEFITAMADQHGLKKIVALGYSNGANIAASLLLLQPGILSGAVLWRAMVPIVPDPLPDLTALPVFLAGGRTDTMISPESTQQLAEMLQKAGAQVTTHWSPGGHQLNSPEIEETRRWLQENFPSSQN